MRRISVFLVTVMAFSFHVSSTLYAASSVLGEYDNKKTRYRLSGYKKIEEKTLQLDEEKNKQVFKFSLLMSAEKKHEAGRQIVEWLDSTHITPFAIVPLIETISILARHRVSQKNLIGKYSFFYSGTNENGHVILISYDIRREDSEDKKFFWDKFNSRVACSIRAAVLERSSPFKSIYRVPRALLVEYPLELAIEYRRVFLPSAMVVGASLVYYHTVLSN